MKHATQITSPESLAQNALAERVRTNPRYSLRAFARSTGISHTVLSLVLSGKRKFSRKAALKLADFLELNPEERRELLLAQSGLPTGAPAKNYRDLDLDSFALISDWYHYGILSALALPDAKLEAKWLAKTLGIGETQAKLAMERLVRLELVERNEAGKFVQTGKPLRIENSRSTEATRNFHRQLLDKAKDSLDADPIEVRNMSSTTFVMDASQVEYAKRRIQDFRRKLSAELEAMGKPTTVYNLTVQLYPVSKS